MKVLRKSLHDFDRGNRAPLAASMQTLLGLIKTEKNPERKAYLLGILHTKKAWAAKGDQTEHLAEEDQSW